MKKYTFMLLLSTVLIIISSCTDTIQIRDDENIHSKSLSSRNVEAPIFDFPTIQWEMFETHEQKLAACEIPDSILPKIPTKDLVEICMKYPLLLDAYAFNTPM